MQDRWGRKIYYARISITDRCNLRCRYCRQEESPFLPEEELLTLDQLQESCRLLADCGITHFKITGGEPFLREDALAFMEWLGRQAFVREVTLTTNGILLKQNASALRRAGVSGVNVSLDTLDRARYKALTGQDGLEQVLAGMEAALSEHLRLRLNVVPFLRYSEEELLDFLYLVRNYPVDVRFITLMPMAGVPEGMRGINGQDIRAYYASKGIVLTPDTEPKGNGPAVYYRTEGCAGRLGFIDALQEKFCGSCNRIRLDAQGSLIPCLYGGHRLDMRALLQGEKSPEEKRKAVKDCIYQKPDCHHFEQGGTGERDRWMNRIGG